MVNFVVINHKNEDQFISTIIDKKYKQLISTYKLRTKYRSNTLQFYKLYMYNTIRTLRSVQQYRWLSHIMKAPSVMDD